MSKITEELVLRNVEDIYKAQLGLIKEAEIREATVAFMADTGAHFNALTCNAKVPGTVAAPLFDYAVGVWYNG